MINTKHAIHALEVAGFILVASYFFNTNECKQCREFKDDDQNQKEIQRNYQNSSD